MRSVLLLALLLAFPAHAEEIVGRASVIDGDTISIRNVRIRLDSVDAPESWQTCTDARGVEYRCGRMAAEALDRFLSESRPTRCVVTGKDRYKRKVAVCQRLDGTDAGAWMVRNGWALDWPRYSKLRYAEDQEAAARARRGMWAGRFEPPWVARKRRK